MPENAPMTTLSALLAGLRCFRERDPRLLLGAILQSMVELTGAEWGMIATLDDVGRFESRLTHSFEPATESAEWIVSQKLCQDTVAQDGVRHISDKRLCLIPDGGSFQRLDMKSALTAPLVSNGRTLGVALLFRKREQRPFSDEEIARFGLYRDAAAEALESSRERLELEKLAALIEGAPDRHFPQIVGTCRVMRQFKERLQTVAEDGHATVLLQGESGTGKDVIANAIHAAGPRKGKPFVPKNMGAIHGGLIESELYGHKKGAFTGAHEDRKGAFETANTGTIFLDEIGDMRKVQQKKLLRVLENRDVTPVGTDDRIPIDVRVVAASHRDLAKLVEMRKFREDLYYRLNVLKIRVPALRERREDIPVLATHLLQKFSIRKGLEAKDAPRLTNDAMKVLMRHRWPGNVRELANVLERAFVFSAGGTIQRSHFEFAPPEHELLADTLMRARVDRYETLDPTEETPWETLGISKSQFYVHLEDHERWCEEHGLPAPASWKQDRGPKPRSKSKVRRAGRRASVGP